MLATTVVLLLVPNPSAGQDGEARFRLSDWGINNLADIRFGQISQIFEPTGPRLVVYELTSDWSPPPAPGEGAQGRTPDLSNGRFVVSSFDGGNRNALDGAFNAFAREPARGSAGLATAPDGVRGLQIACSGIEAGFCGA